MSFDVARVRGLYPTLGSEVAHLDGTYSTLLPETVIRAIVTGLRSSRAQPGSSSPRSKRSAAAIENARRAIGDLVCASPQSVVFGANVSTLLHRFAGLFARDWKFGDEIVISRLDHDANVAPWVNQAHRAGTVVQWAEVDVETGDLPEWQYEKLIGNRTRLVTLPLANPVTGAVPAARRIADLAHEQGALTVIDAGAAVPHLPLDIEALGADLLGISVATFGGPTVGAVVARPGLLEELDEDWPRPSPQRYELGSLPVELIDGVTAAVDHLAALDESATGSRRERLVTSLTSAAAYQRGVFAQLDPLLRGLRGVTVLGTAAHRVPVMAFTVAGRTPAQVGEFLQSSGVSVWTGGNGMSELMSALGTDEMGGTVHVGLMPHTTAAEIEQLGRGLSALLRV